MSVLKYYDETSSTWIAVAKGETGEIGPQGIQGIQGTQGEIGPQGIQGEIGPQGIQGEIGPQGPSGEVSALAVPNNDLNDANTAGFYYGNNCTNAPTGLAYSAISLLVTQNGNTCTQIIAAASSGSRYSRHYTGYVWSDWIDLTPNKLPSGGTTGQMLVKLSDSNFVTQWVDPGSRASFVTLADSGGNFTSENVEGALAELFTFANSGKTSIRNAIGTSEAGANDSFTTLAGYVSTDKTTMATNLTAKGVTATSTETLASLASKIADVTVGGGGGGPWSPHPDWQNIENPGSNTYSFIFGDQYLYNSFVVNTTGSAYTVTVYGADGDTTSTCIINNNIIAFGTPATINSGIPCDITFTKDSGKNTTLGYTCFKVIVTSVSPMTAWRIRYNTNQTYICSLSLLYAIMNSSYTGNTFYFSVDSLTLPPNLQAVKICEGATAIQTAAFQYCLSLEYVSLPSTVTTFGSSAFGSCFALRMVDMPNPNQITSMGTNCFYNCSALSNIALPTSTTVPGYVFSYCKSLSSITVPTGVTTISGGAFGDTERVTTLNLPASGLVTIASGAFSNMRGLREIKNSEYIDNTVTGSVYLDFGAAFNIPELKFPNAKIKRLTCSGNSVTARGKLHSITFHPSSPFDGYSPQINISYTSFSDTELNALFTSLPTVTGKTITITGAVGASTCDKTIATAKGWTVTG